MIVLRDNGIPWLINELHDFASFSDIARRKIIYICVKNLLYTLDENKSKSIRNKIPMILNVHDPIKIVKDIANEMKLIDVDNRFMAALKDIVFRVEQGICPLLWYAFNRWLPKDDAQSSVLELAIMYLYRYEEYEYEVPIGYYPIPHMGATSNIYLNTSTQTICKIASNYVAYKYLLEQEYENVQAIEGSPLQEFLPNAYTYNKQCGYLYHEYISGVNAEFLMEQGSLPIEAKRQLKKFYEYYLARDNKQMILDIHPGNFIWNEHRKKLIFVDLGSIAKIGSEYYDFSSFEEYYKMVWSARIFNKKKFPIRSLDLCIDNVFKRNYGNNSDIYRNYD